MERVEGTPLRELGGASAFSQSVAPRSEQDRFSRLMADDSGRLGSLSTAETTGGQGETAQQAALWEAYYRGLTDWIVRSGIRRTQNHIAEMKRLYRDDF